MAQEAAEAGKLTVFCTVQAGECAECGEAFEPGDLIHVPDQQPLCLSCADLDHLVYLPSGDAALTRRSAKHSPRHAVVLRWNRRRKRYERQGTLVEAEALAQAEEECLADADVRERRRERDAVRREELDQEYLQQFTERIRELFPGCPADEAAAIAEHACLKHSGRVGRSSRAKELQAKAVTLAVRAHIRHTHTPYDDLLNRGVARQDAREQVLAKVEAVDARWRA